MSNLEAKARELFDRIDEDLCFTSIGEKGYALILEALRAERKRALEEAEKLCRECALAQLRGGFHEGENVATECADSINGLEQSE